MFLHVGAMADAPAAVLSAPDAPARMPAPRTACFLACEPLEGRDSVSLLLGAEHRRMAGKKGTTDSNTKREGCPRWSLFEHAPHKAKISVTVLSRLRNLHEKKMTLFLGRPRT